MTYNFLAVDTSSKYLTVLACKGQKQVLRHSEECAMRHSVILMDEIEAAMDEAGLTPAGCDFFCAVTGPGSFTGIRIGLSTIKGMCLACGRPSLPVTSFGLVAYNVKCGGDFAVVIDAMHGMYYCQTFSCEGQPLTPPSYISGGGVAALGLPLFGFEELPLENYTRLNAGSCLPRAVERALGGGFASLGALYVRKSQAEEAASARP